MAKILIADRYKSSIVMTSEVFKDTLTGVEIHLVDNGQDCLKEVEAQPEVFEMIVVDFDLPDTDAVVLTQAIKKVTSKPVIITAFPHPIVEKYIREELFCFADSCAWVKKPIQSTLLKPVVTNFIVKKQRIPKRFDVKVEATIVGQGAGRGKRAPKLEGHIVDLGIYGLGVEFAEPDTFKKGDDVTVHLNATGKTPLPPRIKGKLAWYQGKKGRAGIQFVKLMETQRKVIETYLRPLDDVGPSAEA